MGIKKGRLAAALSIELREKGGGLFCRNRRVHKVGGVARYDAVRLDPTGALRGERVLVVRHVKLHRAEDVRLTDSGDIQNGAQRLDGFQRFFPPGRFPYHIVDIGDGAGGEKAINLAASAEL